MKMIPPDVISHENQLQHLSQPSIFILDVFRTAEHAGQIFIPHRPKRWRRTVTYPTAVCCAFEIVDWVVACTRSTVKKYRMMSYEYLGKGSAKMRQNSRTDSLDAYEYFR